MAQRTIKNRDQVEQEIIQKAAIDAAFRQQLISDPRDAIERALGAALPANVTFTVLEETPTEYYLVLPPAGVIPGAELSDAELGAVAGARGDTDLPATNCPGHQSGQVSAKVC